MSRAVRPLKDGQREAKEIACLNVTVLRLAEFAQVLEASSFVDVTLAALAAAYRKQQFVRFPMPGLFQVQDGLLNAGLSNARGGVRRISGNLERQHIASLGFRGGTLLPKAVRLVEHRLPPSFRRFGRRSAGSGATLTGRLDRSRRRDPCKSQTSQPLHPRCHRALREQHECGPDDYPVLCRCGSRELRG
jgi:hypothetical protein